MDGGLARVVRTAFSHGVVASAEFLEKPRMRTVAWAARSRGRVTLCPSSAEALVGGMVDEMDGAGARPRAKVSRRSGFIVCYLKLFGRSRDAMVANGAEMLRIADMEGGFVVAMEPN
jgi:hypothetical protein